MNVASRRTSDAVFHNRGQESHAVNHGLDEAALLRISLETVRWHVARLFERCGCIEEALADYRHQHAGDKFRAATT